MKNKKIYYKETGLRAMKGADVTPEILSEVNKFAQEPLAADDIYVQKYLMAHNGVDRDRERFPEDLLDDYARTLKGKSFLEAHDRSRLPVGLYFDTATEDMTKEQFKTLTGEDIRLPDGIAAAKVVYGWIYTLRKEWNQKLIDNLSGGIYRHASIGFSATDLKPVKGEYDQVLYFEYIAPGEAREGSIVYLGAQQGAGVQKDPDIQSYKSALQAGEAEGTLCSWINKNKQAKKTEDNLTRSGSPRAPGKKEENMDLKEFLEKLSKEFKTLFTEESIVSEIKAMIDSAGTKADGQLSKKDTEVEELKKQLADLSPLAADGKAYRAELVEDCIKTKAKLGDCSEKEDEQKTVKAVIENYPIDYLKMEREILQKRVAEKFPDEAHLKGDDSRDKSGNGCNTTLADWETPEKNPLIPKTGK